VCFDLICVLCCAVLCCAVLCCAVLCCAVGWSGAGCQAPAIAVDKSNGVQIHLSAEALKANPDIVTSCITAVNIVVPGRKKDDDDIELPLPEQYMSKFSFNGDGTWKGIDTKPTEHSE
jgi:hypothetical protein